MESKVHGLFQIRLIFCDTIFQIFENLAYNSLTLPTTFYFTSHRSKLIIVYSSTVLPAEIGIAGTLYNKADKIYFYSEKNYEYLIAFKA